VLLAVLAGAPAQLRADVCGRGRAQSPIDVVLTQPRALPGLEVRYRFGQPRLANDGHTLRLRFADGGHLIIGTQRFRLQQIHFHSPGGDKVRGEEFPMAAHYLHRGSDGSLLSLVVFFRIGHENPLLARLLDTMPAPDSRERPVAADRLDRDAAIPVRRGYYAYRGSLTAPPCTEGVRWLLLKEALELSADQLARYRHAFADNARATQPLYGRIVEESE